MADIDLNLLIALDALLGEGSVVGAARRLGLSASAMSVRGRGRARSPDHPARPRCSELSMNYLIHFLMAGDDDELRLGNLLGDYVKGRVERFESPGITDRLRTGIQMHRTIDAFSDRHPAVHRSKRILSADYGRLSGVIVDVFYDHVLARRWSEHHPRPLADYTQEVYRTLKANLYRLPPPVHPLVTHMSRGDWLGGYASQRGIEHALKGIAQRRPVAAEIGTAGRLLADHFDRFSADFDEFLPELRGCCAEFLAERGAL